MNSHARPMFGLAVPKDERLKHVNSYILENPSEKVSLQDWADFFHISSKTFNRLVVKETGVTFQQWKNQLLVVNAIELMSKDKNIGWIASELCYGSTSAFSAMLEERLGFHRKNIENKYWDAANSSEMSFSLEGCPFLETSLRHSKLEFFQAE